MNSFTLWGCSIHLLALAATAIHPLPVLAQVPAPTASSVIGRKTLSEDSRLSRVITVNEIGTPLGELLSKLSDDTVTLSCGRSCAEQKIQIHLKGRPLRTLMESLAELLPGHWRPVQQGAGYRLEMDEQTVRRRARWWKLFLAERDKALQQQRALVLQAMRSDGGNLFRGLPASLQDHIARQMNERPFYSNGISSFGTGDTDGAVAVPLTSLPPDVQATVRGNPYSGGQDLPWDDATVYFCNGGISVHAEVHFADGRTVGTVHDMPIVTPGGASQNVLLRLDHSGLPEAVRPLGRRAPRSWKELAEYEESRVWENAPPTEKPRLYPPPQRAEVLQRLAQESDLELVADYYSRESLPLAAIDRRRQAAGQNREKGRLDAQALKQQLDNHAFEQDMSWKQREGGVYLFRNNRWYRDDHLEVPGALLRRWLTLRRSLEQEIQESGPKAPEPEPRLVLSPRLPEHKRQHLDWQAEVVSKLTVWQIANGLKWAATEERSTPDQKEKKPPWAPVTPRWERRPFHFESGRILMAYPAIRFYSGLRAPLRASLIEGRLPLAVLDPVQREQAVFLLPSLSTLSMSKSEQGILLDLDTELRRLVIAPSAPSSPQ